MKKLTISGSVIFFTLFFLIGCEPPGPTEEEIRQEKEASVLSTWNSVLDNYKSYQEDENLKFLTEGITQFNMTNDGRGIIFRESQFEMLGLIGFNTFYFGIPDYIREQIANTAPIDGNQKARYDNVEINWSVDRTGSSYSKTIKIYMSLRLID